MSATKSEDDTTLIQRLKSGDQQAFESFVKSNQSMMTHFDRMRSLEQEMKVLRRDLFTARQAKLSSTALNDQLQQIGKVQVTMDSLTFVHFHEIRTICTPEQTARLQELMEEMVNRKFDGKGAPHRRGGPR